MIKVAFYNDIENIGGHEIMTARIANELAANGLFEILFISSEKLKDHLDSSIIAHRVAPSKTRILAGSVGLLYFQDYYKIAKILKKVKPDLLIVSQGTIELGINVVITAKLLGIPVISYLPMVAWLEQTGSRFLPKTRDFINKHLYRLPDAFITISEGIAEEIRLISSKIKVCTIRNFSPVKKRENGEDVTKNDYISKVSKIRNDGKYIVGIFGRIEFKHKRHDVFLRAWKNFEFDIKKVHFIIAGSGPHINNLNSIIEDLKLSDNIDVLGYVDDMDALYQSIDAIVIPSSFEGVPLVALEAILNQKRIISFNFPGLKDYIYQRDLIELNDFQNLCRAVSSAAIKSTPMMFIRRPSFEIDINEIKIVSSLINELILENIQ